MPKETKFSYASGWFKHDEKKPWKWNPCAEGDEGATYFESPVGKSFGIYNVLVKAEFPDKTFWHMKAAAKVDARYNMGVVQDIKVTPGSELVLTPSWISNGNKNGVDQLQVFIYDAKDFDLRKVEWERNKLKPIFAYTTTHEAAGKQGLVWKVPEKVNRIFVRFNEANRSADHTGLENKSMVALSGFTGAHVTSGSHLLLETSDKNDIRKQIWNKLFNYEFNLINYGYAPVAKGVFTAKLPEGMTVEKIKFILGDKEVLGTIKDGTVKVGLSKIEVGEKARIVFYDVKANKAGLWKLLNPQLAYDTFAINGAYAQDYPLAEGKDFHLLQTYNIGILTNKAEAPSNGCLHFATLSPEGAQAEYTGSYSKNVTINDPQEEPAGKHFAEPVVKKSAVLPKTSDQSGMNAGLLASFGTILMGLGIFSNKKFKNKNI